MTVTIRAFDIEGSSFTTFTHKDYRQERAVRRFLVESTSSHVKTAILAEVIDDIKVSSNLIHPQKYSGTANSYLPLQSASIRKIGRQMWLVEAQYYYPF